jgi:hypothetical protein
MLSRLLKFVLFSGLLVAFPGIANELPSALGLTVGVSTIGNALFLLGPPATTYLAGEDAEYSHPTPKDAIVLRYERRFALASDHLAGVYLSFEPPRYVLRVIHISFLAPSGATSGVPLEEVIETYGHQYRWFRANFACGDDALECGEMCLTPSGQHEIFVYQRLGLHFTLDRTNDHGRVMDLLFSREPWHGRKTLKPCKKSGA